jgi:flagellar protein FliL
MTDKPTDVGTERAPENESPRRGGLMVVLAVSLLALGGGAGAGTFFLGPRVASFLVPDPSAEAGDEAALNAGGGQSDTALNLLTVENLVVNPAGSGGSRFLLVSVALEMRSANQVTSVGARDVELRDALIRCLGSKSVDELADIGQRDALLEEILAALTQVVGQGVINKVFLPQYVIQ